MSDNLRIRLLSNNRMGRVSYNLNQWQDMHILQDIPCMKFAIQGWVN